LRQSGRLALLDEKGDQCFMALGAKRLDHELPHLIPDGVFIYI
jgi:hypothetical protein